MQSNKWIFVSHSSEDLEQVRKVRNYLEEKGASPLLFHLRALDKPEEFWPLIQQEIQARNFFLYCESLGAQESPWVRRERDEVASVSKQRAIRIGTVDVAGDTLDSQALNNFLANLRIYPSFTRLDEPAVLPYLSRLSDAGFDVFDEAFLAAGEELVETLEREMAAAADDGWVLIFVSRKAMESVWVRAELKLATNLGARIVPVLIEPIPDRLLLAEEIRMLQWVDCTADQTDIAIDRLVNELLTRKSERPNPSG